MVKLSLITSFLGQTKDRFHVYNTPLTLDEKLKMMTTIEGFDGVELIYPYEVNDATALKALLAKYQLKVSAINVNVKGEPEFVGGGITADAAAVRAKAIGFLRDAKDFAAAMGVDKVTCCPLGDGYEFAFQCDYRTAWRRIVDAFGEAAAHRPDIKFMVEYKPSETRAKCFIESAAKTLCLIHDIGGSNVGVTLDFGHSIYGGETPAEALSLIAEAGVPYYIHINDNDARWDWDFFCASKHFLEYVEFLYYARKFGYDDYFTSDTSPTRWDIRGTFEANGRITRRIWEFFDRIDLVEFDRLITGPDYLKTWRFIEERMFGLR